MCFSLQSSPGEMLMSSSRYNVSETHSKPGGYSVHMRLTIRNLTADDIDHYTCVAKNSIGEVDSTINVYCECIMFQVIPEFRVSVGHIPISVEG